MCPKKKKMAIIRMQHMFEFRSFGAQTMKAIQRTWVGLGWVGWGRGGLTTVQLFTSASSYVARAAIIKNLLGLRKRDQNNRDVRPNQSSPMRFEKQKSRGRHRSAGFRVLKALTSFRSQCEKEENSNKNS